MKLIALFVILNLIGICSNGQNLIGLHSKDIQKYMKENRKDLSLEKVVNERYKYLKYSDSNDSETVIYFINNDSICRNIRLICIPGSKAEKIREFNSIYKRDGENRWIDIRNGNEYLIEIKDEKWSCVVTIEAQK